jgi:hypothetical protein
MDFGDGPVRRSTCRVPLLQFAQLQIFGGIVYRVHDLDAADVAPSSDFT